MGDELLAILAAGPLKDVLVSHGPTVIDKVEAELKIPAPAGAV